MKKIIVIIEKLDHQGRGMASIDGKVVFVPFTLPDEKVEIEIVREYPRYIEAKVIKITKPSLNRVEPKCAYYETCGGCDLQHMEYKDTVNYKQEKIINIMSKYSGIAITPELVVDDSPYNYRNKISLKIIKGRCGFYENKSNKLIEIKRCEIVDETINNFLKDLDLLSMKNGIITIRVNTKKELLLSITSTDKLNISELVEKHHIVGIVKNHETIYGENYFIEELGKYKYKVSYDAFFQTNTFVNQKLIKLLEDNAPENLNILDLFCGVGSLGLSIANKAKKITGIEIVSSAIKNAKENALLNNIENAEFLCEDILNIDLEKYKDTDLIIVDPPRMGLSEKIIKQINSKYLIYISCDPMTLARDLKELKSNYEIENFYILDMFPYTKHVECFVKLIKK